MIFTFNAITTQAIHVVIADIETKRWTRKKKCIYERFLELQIIVIHIFKMSRHAAYIHHFSEVLFEPTLNVSGKVRMPKIRTHNLQDLCTV